MSTRSVSSTSIACALAAAAALAGASAYANSSAPPSTPPGHAAMIKDFGKLSADGVQGYQDLTLARLAIYDGRTAEAKSLVDDAAMRFDKAKTDESVFTAAEATMRKTMPKASTAGDGKTPGAENGSDANKSASADTSPNAKAAGADDSNDANKPVSWLPVYGTVTIDQDYTMQPAKAKAKAVADANKSLAQGDRKTAMDKLKLAEVDTSVILAVVPLQKTVSDVDNAKQLIDAGKFYEGSQKLRAVQDATVFTVADIPEVPARTQSGSAHNTPPATH